tara:strand:- start:1140 stop:1472 length:333 start_codon:yes stop_codon:yes gene_type:complete
MDKPYKYQEIEEHFQEWLSDQEGEWIEDNIDDLHHHAFNTDYYIIGTQKAIEWMGSKVFAIIETIKEYEEDNFGEVTTDLSNPEKLVNMYTYIIGEEIVNEFVSLREEAA